MSSPSLPGHPNPLPLEDLVGLPPKDRILKRYNYRAISEDVEDIRVVTILPGHDSQEVRCTISHSVFSSESRGTEYEGLSYTWGSNVKSHAAIVDDTILPVTQNLHAALRRFRLHDQPRALWVDAICIDQANISELNKQVQSMAQIYQGSKRVLIWLGEEDEATPEAFSCIDRFDESYWADKGGVVPQSRSDNEEFFLSVMPSPACVVNWQATSSLLGRPWFSRAWVVQEAILAPKALMVCGSHSCKWTTLNQMLEYLNFSNIEFCLGGHHKQARLIGDLRETWNSSPEEPPILSLFILLCLTPEFSCQDPRDRVFSLLGLISNKTSQAIEIDYSVSCRDLYISVARRFIGIDERWMLLSCASHEKLSTFDLPSWVPDWSLGAQGGPGNSHIGSGFSAGGSRPDFASILVVDDVLSFRGVVFDVVNIIGGLSKIQKATRTMTQFFSTDTMMSAKEIFLEIERITSIADPYPTGEISQDVISQMLAGANTKSPKWIQDVLPHRRCYDNILYISKHMEDIIAQRFEDLDKVEMEFSLSSEMMEYNSRIAELIAVKEIGISQKGFLGWLPSGTIKDDLICTPLGCEVPYILRKDGDEYYELVGECYFHGIMHGEGVMTEDLDACEFKIR